MARPRHRHGHRRNVAASAPAAPNKISVKVLNDRVSLLMMADTVGSLKARMKKKFSLTDDDLNQRLLVPDNRGDFHNRPTPNLVNGQDLLELEDGSLLKEVVKDGDNLNLGWKVPFTIELTEISGLDIFYSMSTEKVTDVSCYDTFGELKRKIEMATGEPVTENNLPDEYYFYIEDEQTLLSFGFYSLSQHRNIISIYRNRYNSISYGTKPASLSDYASYIGLCWFD